MIQVEQLSKDLVKTNSELKHLEENCKTEEAKKSTVEGNTLETQQLIAKKQKELEQMTKSNKKFEDLHKKYAEELLSLQEQYQTLCTGISSDSVGSKTLNQRFMGKISLLRSLC